MSMDKAVERAFIAVPRRHFLPENVVYQAPVDAPLPIGFGQTNSQPSTVAMMLEWLQVESGQHILDVGSGSGWTSALLAYLARPKGSVVAVEVVPELVRFGLANSRRAGIRNIEFYQAGEVIGYPASAPYDRILVSASARDLPPELVEQLAPEGRMVIPVGHIVQIVDKDAAGKIEVKSHPGFIFVPLV